MKYIVYLTINLKSKVNGINRMYCGIHKVTDIEQFDNYLGDGVYMNQPSTYMYPKTPFQYAVKKYGVTSFKRITLFAYDTLEEAILKEREIVNDEFIKQTYTYNTYINDYLYKPIYQFNVAGQLVKKWNTAMEICEFYGVFIFKLEYAIKNNCLFLDYLWNTTEECPVQKDYNIKIVFLYSKEGKLINGLTRQECVELTGSEDITGIINRQCLIHNKYYLSPKVVDEFIPKPRRQYNKIIFYVYDIEGNYYGPFKGKKVMKVINQHSWAKIQRAMQENKGWYKNFYLSEVPIDKVPERYVRQYSIDVYDKLGNYIESFDSFKAVRDKYQVPSSKLKDIEQGNKYYKDWIFKYHSK